MSRFYIIDQSMCRPAGHHFDYTRNVALAAADQNYQTIVGANRKFAASESAHEFGRTSLRCCFKNNTYSKLSRLPGLRKLTRSVPPPIADASQQSWVGRRSYRNHCRHREEFLEQFNSDCQHFFADAIFESGDQVFFVTMTELECEGVARFLIDHPTAHRANWHLQFHFELFLGLASQYQLGPGFGEIRNQFAAMKQRLPQSVFFYATSDGLAQQYNQLNAFQFEELSYPVNPGFLECRNSQNNKTQFACFGGIRREKGIKSVAPALAESIAKDSDYRSRLELVVQGKPSELPIGRKRFAKHMKWQPLPAPNYVDLVHSADVGLLYYNRSTFANRVSSTLNEFLCAGKPVIVSGGTWLHRKIQKPIWEYQQSLFNQSTVVKQLTDNLTLAGADKVDGISISLDDHAGAHRLLTFNSQWPQFNRVGAHGLMTITALSSGMPICTSTEIISPVEADKHIINDVFACAEIPAGADRIEVSFSNAYDESVVNLNAPCIGILTDNRPISKSQVGIVAAAETEIFGAVKHIADHLTHYQNSAAAFSKQLHQAHHPSNTIEQLVSRAEIATRDNEIGQFRKAA